MLDMKDAILCHIKGITQHLRKHYELDNKKKQEDPGKITARTVSKFHALGHLSVVYQHQPTAVNSKVGGHIGQFQSHEVGVGGIGGGVGGFEVAEGLQLRVCGKLVLHG